MGICLPDTITFEPPHNRKVMERTILFLALGLLPLACLDAQTISDHALGIRVGDNDGFGAEISYQHKLGPSNRVQADLGLRDAGVLGEAFKLTGIYHWVFPLDGNFQWYAGVGAGVGAASNNLTLTVDGDIGIEYSFANEGLPLQLALNANPDLGVENEFADDLGLDLGLALRYQF